MIKPMDELTTSLKKASQDLFGVDIEPELSRPDEKFGDYATNAALQLGKQLGKTPREVADALAGEIQKTGLVAKVAVAGPGFINFTLKDEALAKAAFSSTDLPKPLAGQEILVEFGDPNPFKEMHIGHLYQYIVGDAISSLLEANGADVKRLSYHGDVGLQVAKAFFGIQALDKDRRGQDEPSDAEAIERENFFGKAYAYGADKYENDPAAKEEIDAINLHIYQKNDPEIIELHKKGCNLSFEYFDKILDLLSISNDKRYLESQTIEPGEKLIEKNLGRVFKKSDGAIIYEGEKVGLHTRVFITSKGLPTYETKDLGLTQLKKTDYPGASRSIIITGSEQSEYFKVMLAALAEIDAALAKKTTHLSSGFVSLTSGKMSSRSGNVYAAMELLLEVKAAVHEQYPDSEVRKEVTLAAVKYAFLKHRLGSDIVVDIKESIGLEGNSGPYLQYAFARANGILKKVDGRQQAVDSRTEFEAGERSLARKISEYPEVVAKATAELMPHHICTYLYELAQAFNSFYENNRVIDDNRQAIRLQLVGAYANVLKHGLNLLNIEAPEQV
jgi:arginyl-tRNA synthetase